MADMGEAPEGMTIDRKDTNGNYEPTNCKWSTQKEQQRNRSSNTVLTIEGVPKTLVEWCETYSISANAVGLRLKRGWTIEEALATPTRKLHAGGQPIKRSSL